LNTGGYLKIPQNVPGSLPENQHLDILTFINGDIYAQYYESDNIKAVLTNIAVFELSPRRSAALGTVFGHAIFTTMAKNGQLLEHFSASISSKVGLQKLFFMLTLDTATEFLFEHGTDTLGTGG
jgi:hypothetical protein